MTRRILCLAALIALAAGVRLLAWPSVAGDDGSWRWAGGPDSWYQARRADLAAAGEPLAPDLWINFPDGERVHWPAAWARIMGAVLVTGGPGALALLPVIIGTATTLVLASAARRALTALGATTSAAPWLSGVAFAVLPALVYPSVIGALDHHHLEALWAAMACLGGVLGGRRGLVLAAAATAAAGISVPAWPVVALFAVLPPLVARAPQGLPALGLLAAGALALPVAGFSYFADPWIAGIEEAKPLITAPRELFRAIVMLSPGFLILPFFLAAWWNRRRVPAAATVLATAVIASPVALLQARFVPYLAFSSVVALAAFLDRRTGPPRFIAFLALLCLLPSARGVADIVGWNPDPSDDVEEALAWMARETEPAGDRLDGDRLPAWGVVAAWDLGNHIVQVARRPAVADAFHTGASGRERVAHILGDTPAEATAAADAVPARYLLLTNLAGGYLRQHRLAGQPAPVDALYGRLYFRNDTALGWRRVHASKATFVFEDLEVPEVQVWERETRRQFPAGETMPARAGKLSGMSS